MTTTEIKAWIKNIIHVHREILAVEFPSISVASVWNVYMDNSDDVYLNIYEAFKVIGYDIEK